MQPPNERMKSLLELMHVDSFEDVTLPMVHELFWDRDIEKKEAIELMHNMLIGPQNRAEEFQEYKEARRPFASKWHEYDFDFYDCLREAVRGALNDKVGEENVVELKIASTRPHAQIIEYLEEALRLAQTGEAMAVGCVITKARGASVTFWSTGDSKGFEQYSKLSSLIAASHTLQNALVKAYDES